MPLEITKLDDPGKPGWFELRAASAEALTPDERTYQQTVAEIFQQLDRELAIPASTSDLGKLKDAFIAGKRKDYVENLGQAAATALAPGRTISAPEWGEELRTLTTQAILRFGRYLESTDLIRRRAFETSSEEIPDDGAKRIEIKIYVVDAQDESAPQPSEAATKLFTRIGETASVFDTVLQQMRPSRSKFSLRRIIAYLRGLPPDDGSFAYAMHKEFTLKLLGVAEMGLRGARPALGMVALEDLKEQYRRRMAPLAKNAYMEKLGFWCFLVALTALAFRHIALSGILSYGCSKNSYMNIFCFGSEQFWETHQTFFFLIVGSAFGAWTSFAMRNVEFTFLQLAAPEADLVEPKLRVVFVAAITVFVGLLIWTKAVNASVAGLQLDAFRTSGSVALLLGTFCGLSERALSSALKNNADTIAAGVAETQGKPRTP